MQLILLLLGCIVIAGIVWDTRKSRQQRDRMQSTTPIRTHGMDDEADEAYESHYSNGADLMLIHVVAKNGIFSGGDLLEAFNEAHLYYGEMQIFHRYANLDGSGNLVFSVVSAIEPGYFELSKMANLVTPAITLFFKLTKTNQPIAALEAMLRVAKQLASRLQGELRDEKHRFVTHATIEQYRSVVRRRFAAA